MTIFLSLLTNWRTYAILAMLTCIWYGSNYMYKRGETSRDKEVATLNAQIEESKLVSATTLASANSRNLIIQQQLDATVKENGEIKNAKFNEINTNLTTSLNSSFVLSRPSSPTVSSPTDSGCSTINGETYCTARHLYKQDTSDFITLAADADKVVAENVECRDNYQKVIDKMKEAGVNVTETSNAR